MVKALNVIVTGANRGIGRAICEAAFRRSDIPSFNLYACSRSGDDLKLGEDSDLKKVTYEKLDISDPKSVEALREKLTASNQTIDVLINNAGVNLDRQSNLDNARRTLDVNYYGTLKMCEAFLPYMPDGGRIVNLSSIASVLKLYKEDMRERFRSASTLDDVDRLGQDYLGNLSSKTEEASGFGSPGRSYNVSKALVNAATRILAEEHKSLVINSCCPGWIDTDMGVLVGKPTKTLEQGTVIPLRLAFEDLGGISGRFWANSSVSGTGNGQPQRW